MVNNLPKKLTYVVSDMSKMVALEWICEYRDHQKTELSFIFLNKGDSEIEQFVKLRGYKFLRIAYNGKRDIPKSIFLIWRFLIKNKSEIVHCHLFDACLIGLFAALFTQVKKRIHTRHYATYHHVYFPKAVRYDRLINLLSTDIIAISELVRNVLMEREYVSPKKIHLIHHGFLLQEYAEVDFNRIALFKKKYEIKDEDIIIGVVARYTLLKGIQYVIPAFINLLNDYPNAKLLIANSHGNDETYLRTLLREIPSNNLIEVKYERDMGALYKSLSVYVHVPIYNHIEAFGQTYIEALMSGIPSVFTLSGVAQEFIKHEHNALVVPFENAKSIYQSIKRLLEDKNLYQHISKQGYIDVESYFGLKKMINQLESLYLA